MTSQQSCLTLALFATMLLPILFCGNAGPDPTPFPGCIEKLKTLNREKRIDMKGALQAVQALTYQVELGRLTSANQTHIQQLESWIASNRTKIAGMDVAESCLAHRRTASSYIDRPVFSILLEYFKRPWSIRRMASSLQDACRGAQVPCELVVNVDNPHEAPEWAAVAVESGGFVVPVFSANVHEARGYNRAARAARGKLLIIWQDDQIAPADSSWLLQLQQLFAAWPQLAIVGMNTYRLCRHFEPTNRFFQTPWDPDPRTGVRWSFVQFVDFAPLVIRGRAFASLGGLDEGFTRPGDCGIWGDWELCNRAWLDGWQVGYLFLAGRSGDGHEGGTHTVGNAEKCWGRQLYVAAGVHEKRFGAMGWQSELCERVWRLNVETFTIPDPSSCPYASEATRFANCTRPS